MTDVRTFSPTPMDLALISRLASDQLLMDTVTALTRGVNPLESALLTVIPLADLGFPTLILRQDDHGYVAQIRHRSGETHAHLAVLAPSPSNAMDVAPWSQLIQGLLRTAVQRGAIALIAELPEHTVYTAELLRQSGFVPYARQTIFRRNPAKLPGPIPLHGVMVRPALEKDRIQVNTLIARQVPAMIQHACPPLRIGQRLAAHAVSVFSSDHQQLLGYLNIEEGRSGLLVTPLLHPDLYDDAATIMQAAIRFWPKAERLPLYCRVGSYQEWLATPLMDTGMDMADRQILFVKHMALRVKTRFEMALSRAEQSQRKLIGNWDINFQQDKLGDTEWNTRSQTTSKN